MKLKILAILTFASATILIQSYALAQSLPFNIYQGPITRGVRPWASLGQWINNAAVQSSFMQVPGSRGLYMNVWTGQYYSVTPEGDIDLSRSGQNYEGSLAAWDVCFDGGGGDACMANVDYRIKAILQTY
ncbi:MAG TPA: hypothetical protein VE954_27675 [Oligoflexus sp.]|uniref:hypothetical protein n=1 Tax=Oligoflexus sp. TaxID=1971216 RepID=UPI002D75B2F8|nr:hypothetical protein [Oligoflexus sp.]HYX36905.1 hypothetical protein [Oligoflexus sp.]